MIRSATPRDLDGMRSVCPRTSDGGQDASALYADPAIVPAIFLDPYVDQGRGLGRALVERFGAALVAQGVPGLHVDVSLENPGSQRFFERLGFERIENTSPIRVVHFGRALAVGPRHARAGGEALRVRARRAQHEAPIARDETRVEQRLSAR
jgi:hypothetical protein